MPEEQPSRSSSSPSSPSCWRLELPGPRHSFRWDIRPSTTTITLHWYIIHYYYYYTESLISITLWSGAPVLLNANIKYYNIMHSLVWSSTPIQSSAYERHIFFEYFKICVSAPAHKTDQTISFKSQDWFFSFGNYVHPLAEFLSCTQWFIQESTIK